MASVIYNVNKCELSGAHCDCDSDFFFYLNSNNFKYLVFKIYVQIVFTWTCLCVQFLSCRAIIAEQVIGMARTTKSGIKC